MTGTPTVLVVEDDLSLREGLQDVLEIFGYNVLLASNGEEGLAMFKQHQADITFVTTDIDMPVMNGVQMAKQIKALCPAMQVVAVTSHSEEELPAIFDGTVQKPFDYNNLIQVAATVVENARGCGA